MSKTVWTIYGCVLSLVLASSMTSAQAQTAKQAARPPVAQASGAFGDKTVCELHACVLSSIMNGPGQPGWLDGIVQVRFEGGELTSGSRQVLAASAKEARAANEKGQHAIVDIHVLADSGLSEAAAWAQVRARSLALRQYLDGVGLNDVKVSY